MRKEGEGEGEERECRRRVRERIRECVVRGLVSECEEKGLG